MIIYLCISTSTSNRVYLDYQIQLGNLRISSEATTASNTAQLVVPQAATARRRRHRQL
jgi:hypothetical protein